MVESVIGLNWSGIDKRFKVYSIVGLEVYFLETVPVSLLIFLVLQDFNNLLQTNKRTITIAKPFLFIDFPPHDFIRTLFNSSLFPQRIDSNT